MKKKKYLRIPPELYDGENHAIVEASEDECRGIGSVLWAWVCECEPLDGDEVKLELEIELVALSEEEFEALPEL